MTSKLILLIHFLVEGRKAIHAQRHLARLALHGRPLEPQPEARVPRAAEGPGAGSVLALDGHGEVSALKDVVCVLLLLLVLLPREGGVRVGNDAWCLVFLVIDSCRSRHGVIHEALAEACRDWLE